MATAAFRLASERGSSSIATLCSNSSALFETPAAVDQLECAQIEAWFAQHGLRRWDHYIAVA